MILYVVPSLNEQFKDFCSDLNKNSKYVDEALPCVFIHSIRTISVHAMQVA